MSQAIDFINTTAQMQCKTKKENNGKHIGLLRIRAKNNFDFSINIYYTNENLVNETTEPCQQRLRRQERNQFLCHVWQTNTVHLNYFHYKIQSVLFATSR